jgi:hypothetical protein
MAPPREPSHFRLSAGAAPRPAVVVLRGGLPEERSSIPSSESAVITLKSGGTPRPSTLPDARIYFEIQYEAVREVLLPCTLAYTETQPFPEHSMVSLACCAVLRGRSCHGSIATGKT